ncbi:MAG: beta-lactamase family protein, partial [Treponema sp.]|nr:beta-lactamase family protein [Treponema sp.]
MRTSVTKSGLFRIFALLCAGFCVSAAEAQAGSDTDYFLPGGRLDTFLRDLADRGLFSGTVGVGRAGEVLFLGGYGYADLDAGRAMRPDTGVNLGSVNKSFTAVAIGQLAQSGRLSYGDAVETFLPEFAEISAGLITIEHLLRHTSGLGDFRGNPDYIRNMNDLQTIAQMLPYAIPERLLFAPGSGYSYSNSGYLALGAVIERVSGEDYYAYVGRHIFARAGMENTGSYRKTDQRENLAIGYYLDEAGRTVSNIANMPLLGNSAGGGYSTAEDMLRYIHALNGDVFMRDTALTLIPEIMVSGMAGGAPGVSAIYENHAESGYYIVILSNASAGHAAALDEIRRFLFAAPPRPSLARVAVEINGLSATLSALRLGDEIFLPLFETGRAAGASVSDGGIEFNGAVVTVSDNRVSYLASGDAVSVPSRTMMLNGSAVIFIPLEFFQEIF